MHDLGYQVANSVIGPKIRDLGNSVSDLSCGLTPSVLCPTPFSSILRPPSSPTSGTPRRPSTPGTRQSPETPRPNMLPRLPPSCSGPMTSPVAPANWTKQLPQMPPPVVAKAKARSLPRLPPPPQSYPAFQAPHLSALLLSPVPQMDPMSAETCLPHSRNPILSAFVGATRPPAF